MEGCSMGCRGERSAVVIALSLTIMSLVWLTSCSRRPPSVRPVAASGPTTVVGEIGGAPYRIDIPAGWNGELVIYCHGYRGAPVHFDAHAVDPMVQAFAPLGY